MFNFKTFALLFVLLLSSCSSLNRKGCYIDNSMLNNIKEGITYRDNVIEMLGEPLYKFDDNTFDVVLLFGPMYHLISDNDKLKALSEAKRILKDNGLIFISYYMNEYAIITHGFIENTIKEDIQNNLIDNTFHITPKEDDLYSMVRLEDINYYKDTLKLHRIKIIAQDGPTDYLRSTINKMDNETFELYYKYHLSTCEKAELLGASSHVLDILKK